MNFATHVEGGHIDQVYFKVYSNDNFVDPILFKVYHRDGSTKFDVDVKLYSPYYTAFDHDALCITAIRITADNEAVSSKV